MWRGLLAAICAAFSQRALDRAEEAQKRGDLRQTRDSLSAHYAWERRIDALLKRTTPDNPNP